MSDNLKLTLNGTVIEIMMDDNGRYCLNDLFKASGATDNKKPAKYLRNKECGVDVVNLDKRDKFVPFPEDFDSYVVLAGVGRGSKTFAPLKIVYKYASFISKEFENAVYSAFTALATGDVKKASVIAESITISPEILAKEQHLRKKMNEMIKDKFPDAKPYIYGNFGKLVSKAATGFTPKVLTGGGKSAKDYIVEKEHEPAISAMIATYEMVIMMLSLPYPISYQDVATVLKVETTKNKKHLKSLGI